MGFNEGCDEAERRALDTLRRNFGADALAALADERTVEIMLNPDGTLWLERLGEEMHPIGKMDRYFADALIRGVAAWHNREVNERTPLLEAEFPLDGSRFAGQLPPIVSAPTFTIRKPAVAVFTLDQYVENAVMTEHACLVLKNAVRDKRNILVTGGTGSGKTTLVKAIIGEMVRQNPRERLITIEDTLELRCEAENAVPFKTDRDVTMTALLRTSLRMRPDRILVGEVRGAEALDLLMAWNTGHEGGCATVHANNALAGLHRLETLISMHPYAPRPAQPVIAEAVHLVTHIAREARGRRVQGIIEVLGYEGGRYVTKPISN